MRAYRITREEFAEDLSGEGARRFGGRWNRKGFSALYTASSISLAALEVLAHTSIHTMPEDLVVVEIEIPDEASRTVVPLYSLPENWRSFPAPAQLADLGTDWLRKNETLALEVPSVLIPKETNFILNPRHSEFEDVKIVEVQPFAFDARLLA